MPAHQQVEPGAVAATNLEAVDGGEGLVHGEADGHPRRPDAGADQPARLAVIGHPIAHSASPPMHQAALDAARSGVKAVHIIDGRVEHALLLEVLTDQGVGTLIRSK